MTKEELRAQMTKKDLFEEVSRLQDEVDRLEAKVISLQQQRYRW